ncbi:MAG: hypothetical protein ACRDOD_19030 [Streptosporangiaceae bacterium]
MTRLVTPEVLAHVLSPSRAGGRHRPGAHGMLFGDAATLLADPGLTEPEAAAWMLLSVLSARPWRAAVMPGPDRLEGDVADLALRALVPPSEHG